MDAVTGAVLAGGMASRFEGAPKGLELVGGERILDRVVTAVSVATGKPPLIVANAKDAAQWRADCQVVPDLVTGCGSLGGILTALATMKGPVLVTAWDMPFLSADLLQALVRGWKSYDGYFPSSEGPLGLEPLCGVYGPTCEAPVRRAIDDEDFRTTAFHDEIRVGKLSLDDVSSYGDPAVMFFNVNTREDSQRADELWRAQYQHET